MSVAPFSIRSFLRARQALVVHFNTPMSTRHPSGFPGDLQMAQQLKGTLLSFSTIQVGDRGPWEVHPNLANAGGSVGIVVDVRDIGGVVSVDWTDSGSIPGLGSAGRPPDATACAESLDRRKNANEWWVQDFDPVGIFMFGVAGVFRKSPDGQGEDPVDLAEVLSSFPADRIFSLDAQTFLEFDRQAQTWRPVTYGDILPNG